MATKRATLTDFAATKPQAAAPAAKPAVPAPAATPATKKDERRGQTLRLSIGAWKQLKIMAAEEEKPVHEILVEAVNEAFRRRGKPPIA